MSYLEGTIKQFQYYEKLGGKTIDRLSEKQCFQLLNGSGNNVAVIVKHMAGNMLSRFTDFLSTDGEKPWRNRDDEFKNDLQSKEEVVKCWKKGWDCLFGTILNLNEVELEKIVYIRNEGNTIQEAINRQLAHYAYHIGQIVFIGKTLLKEDWESLSVPLGDSEKYNENKFSKPKGKTHFTDEFLEED